MNYMGVLHSCGGMRDVAVEITKGHLMKLVEG